MSKKYLSILIIVILIIGVGVFYFFFSKQPQVGKDEAILIINFGENKRAFAGEVVDGMTIIDALSAAANAGNFDYLYQDGTLKKIDSFEQDGGQWLVFLNDNKVEEFLDKITIKPKDKIELKFEK